MARKNTGKNRPFPEVLRGILEAENKTYDDAGIVRTFIISFPNRHKTPLMGRFGAYLIKKAGGVVQMNYQQVLKK